MEREASSSIPKLFTIGSGVRGTHQGSWMSDPNPLQYGIPIFAGFSFSFSLVNIQGVCTLPKIAIQAPNCPGSAHILIHEPVHVYPKLQASRTEDALAVLLIFKNIHVISFLTSSPIALILILFWSWRIWLWCLPIPCRLVVILAMKTIISVWNNLNDKRIPEELQDYHCVQMHVSKT